VVANRIPGELQDVFRRRAAGDLGAVSFRRWVRVKTGEVSGSLAEAASREVGCER
jgi:hypothetical protein